MEFECECEREMEEEARERVWPGEVDCDAVGVVLPEPLPPPLLPRLRLVDGERTAVADDDWEGEGVCCADEEDGGEEVAGTEARLCDLPLEDEGDDTSPKTSDFCSLPVPIPAAAAKLKLTCEVDPE